MKMRNKFTAAHQTVKSATTAIPRPRPQPIAGTPPPDPNEKCDSKIILQTCNLFGLDLVKHFRNMNNNLVEFLIEILLFATGTSSTRTTI